LKERKRKVGFLWNPHAAAPRSGVSGGLYGHKTNEARDEKGIAAKAQWSALFPTLAPYIFCFWCEQCFPKPRVAQNFIDHYFIISVRVVFLVLESQKTEDCSCIITEI
jgi:hypothetical protein